MIHRQVRWRNPLSSIFKRHVQLPKALEQEATHSPNDRPAAAIPSQLRDIPKECNLPTPVCGFVFSLVILFDISRGQLFTRRRQQVSTVFVT